MVNRRAFLVLAGGIVAGCGTGSASGETKTVRYQGWAGQVTPPELAADLGYLGDVKLEWVGNTISGPQDIQSAATGQVDFGGAFNGAVVKLASGNAPITAVISYYGVDEAQFSGYYVLANSRIRSARDLVGAKVGMNTLGAHSEAMLDTYLQRNGVERAEFGQVERLALPPVNTEQALRQGQVDVAVLGGILRDKALKTGGIRPLFTDFDLLGRFSAGTYVMTERFLKDNPSTTKTFVTAVAKAIDWSRTTPRDQVIKRMRDILTRRARNEDPDPLDYWKSYGVAEPGGRIQDKELQVWVDWLTERGDLEPGAVKVGDLYSNQFNGGIV
ncbi:ABC transporter substrate-binding protein [Actinosynnema sp. ALI-1.44]|uniref:ABC transporter substrate-binding protein n=1 Tax=Actinosynnema sp. ALI-1.44 TaxID=1933779 RepID=UPI001EDA1713|nr:ABC transporter substrate-binding protein [Actinosynnema sp. ALI-1.44]